MGYKYKATMYYSDEKTAQFLNEHAHKRNGKKSASHYLYSLVTKEREKAISTEIKSKSTAITLHQEYHPIERTIDGYIEFTSLDNIRSAKRTVDANKKPIYKNIIDEINKKIEKYINEEFINNDRCGIKNDGFIAIRTYITVNAHHAHTVSEYCKGHFTATFLIINICPDEYDRFCSKFNFDKIKYYKYEDIAKASKHVPSSLCKIAEMKPRDPTGAFFIPVMNINRQLSCAFGSGKTLIVGVGIYDGEHRVKIKSSNKTQINNFKLREWNDS